MAKLLDHRLDCKTCGTIYLDIPEGTSDDAPVFCSTCGVRLGTWGEMKADFRRQAVQTDGVYDLHDGQFEVKTTGVPPKSE